MKPFASRHCPAAPLRRFLRAPIALLCCALALPGAGLPLGGQAVSPSESSTDARVETLLGRMTLAEKIGQLTQVGDPKKISDERIRSGEIGALLDATDPAELRHFQEVAVRESRLHIPLLLGFDSINGFRTLFPVEIAQAATWDPALVERTHAAVARESAAVGLNWTFAPMLDIARDPRWGRIVESAGEDPWLDSAMTVAKVKGLQGTALGTPEHVLACAKHFAGYGAPVGGRDYDSVYLPEEQLQNVYLPPFHAAVDAGIGSMMSAYMSLNDIPASGNRYLLHDVLRDQWNFRGFVVSDSWAVHTMQAEGYARDLDDAAVRALGAGENMDMGSETYAKFLAGDAASGKVAAVQIDEAVRPILRVKVQLGLFEHPFAGLGDPERVLTDPATRVLARQTGASASVLLRNDGSVLPLSKETRTLAVIGALADSTSAMMGSWPGKAHKADTVTILAGLRELAGKGTTVLYEPGTPVERGLQSELNTDTIKGTMTETAGSPDPGLDPGIEKAVALVTKADAVVLVAGEDGSMNGEYASRASIGLPGRQLALVQRVSAAATAAHKPLVLLLVNGRPLDITWASTHIPAILEVWQGGTEGGHAVADLLFGKAAPGGRLPFSWPRSTGQIPVFYARNATKIDQAAKDYKSFYWDETTAPLYPFGFGLSYTSFRVHGLELDRTSIAPDGALTAAVTVTNTGSRSGTEVVQLYLHQSGRSLVRPVRELKGFATVELAPGESRVVRLPIGKDQLQFWTPVRRAFAVEPGPVDVWVGENSKADLHAAFTVRDTGTNQSVTHQ